MWQSSSKSTASEHRSPKHLHVGAHEGTALLRLTIDRSRHHLSRLSRSRPAMPGVEDSAHHFNKGPNCLAASSLCTQWCINNRTKHWEITGIHSTDLELPRNPRAQTATFTGRYMRFPIFDSFRHYLQYYLYNTWEPASKHDSIGLGDTQLSTSLRTRRISLVFLVLLSLDMRTCPRHNSRKTSLSQHVSWLANSTPLSQGDILFYLEPAPIYIAILKQYMNLDGQCLELLQTLLPDHPGLRKLQVSPNALKVSPKEQICNIRNKE